MTIQTIIGRLRGGTPTAENLREVLAQLDLPAAERAVEELTATRQAALLEATDAEVAKIEDRLAKAIRDRDRAVAAKQELETRLTAAEHAEAEAALDAKIAAAEKRAEAAAAAVRKALEVHGAPIVAALAEAAKSAEELSVIGRSLGIAPTRPYPASMESRLNGLFWPSKVNTPHSVLLTTSLPPVGKSSGWGAALEAHRIMYGQPEHMLETHQRLFGMPAGPNRGY